MQVVIASDGDRTLLTMVHISCAILIRAKHKQYQRNLTRRFEQESQSLAKLTGWNIQDIRKKNNVISQPAHLWQKLGF